MFYRNYITADSFGFHTRPSDTNYPKGEVRGIDISHYQRHIDWNALRNATLQDAPLRFVFIKATEGTNIFDPNFNLNFAQARRHGIVRGAYHFFSTKSSGAEQARYFCRMVQLESGDLPPVLDVEVDIDKVANYSRDKLRTEVLAWLRIAEDYYGVPPIIYASSAYKQRYLNGEAFDHYPFWIAHYYVSTPSYAGQWTFWQHTDQGKVDGIKGNVDVNVFNGSAEDFYRLLIPEE